jgi:hypothetical protein
MKYEHRYITFDNKEFPSREEALDHLDELRGKVIHNLAVSAIDLDWKYTTFVTWLDNNLNEIAAKIHIIESDRKMPDYDDE